MTSTLHAEVVFITDNLRNTNTMFSILPFVVARNNKPKSSVKIRLPTPISYLCWVQIFIPHTSHEFIIQKNASKHFTFSSMFCSKMIKNQNGKFWFQNILNAPKKEFRNLTKKKQIAKSKNLFWIMKKNRFFRSFKTFRENYTHTSQI